MAKAKAKAELHDEDRPRVHPDVHPGAHPGIRWTQPNPPRHDGSERLIKRPEGAAEAIRVDGVWISPGEQAWVREKEAVRLVKERQAEKVSA
ncbi:MAG: hypothetical protein M3R70_06320 [Actinomycetota bacterium]|nr:hypothetical protein [Actinomycetota bacterium]